MPPAKHTALWARYLELCERMDHFAAVRQLARERQVAHDEMGRTITAQRQGAKRRGERVPDIPDELLRAAKISGSRSQPRIAPRSTLPLPPLQPVPPGAWNPAPLRAILEERGVSCTDLDRWMNGKPKAGGYARGLVTGERRYPTLATLEKVARALDVPLEVIRGDYTPPDKYELLFGRKPRNGGRRTPPEARDELGGMKDETRPGTLIPHPSSLIPPRVDPPPGMVRVSSLYDFRARLEFAARRARRRRLQRAAGLLPLSALQRLAQEIKEAQDGT